MSIKLNCKIKQKQREYTDYIEKHRENVKKAWEIIDKATQKYKANSWGQQNGCNAHIIIDGLIQKHDMSKYSKEEFEPYRKRFFPIDGKVFDKEEFEKAWQHHKDNNLHHWQSMQAIDYDHVFILEYTIEMLCDWLAMAMNFNEGHRDYYNKNKDDIMLEKWQREVLEDVYGALDKWYEDETK